MDMKNLFSTFALFFIGMAACFAWGHSGHVIIGKIAEKHLTDKSKEAIKSILGDESLGEAGTWLDRVAGEKQYRGQDNWHFAYKDKDFEDNALAKIEEYKSVLKDANSSKDDKVFALRVLIHIMEDIHNPIHCSYYKDFGGHNVKLKWAETGEKTNLHKVWDSDILHMKNLDDDAYTAELEQKADKGKFEEWSKDEPLAWVRESQSYLDQVYQFSDKKVDKAYYEKNIPVIDKRLTQAGIRLAALLNEIFA